MSYDPTIFSAYLLLEAEVRGLVIDHEDQARKIVDVGTNGARWVTGTCSVCGMPCAAHLSWGVAIAARIGGHPLDYVQRVHLKAGEEA